MGSDKSLPSIGFLTIRTYEGLGLIGGYLVLNVQGRPLEFHCTAPVKPSRPQEILYGPTLLPFLYGEQIGETLISRSKNKPMFVCTDQQQALAVREAIAQPVFLVEEHLPDNQTQPAYRIDAAHPSVSSNHLHFQLDEFNAVVAESHPDDMAQIQSLWERHSVAIDLLEPFGRLAEALDETQGGANR